MDHLTHAAVIIAASRDVDMGCIRELQPPKYRLSHTATTVVAVKLIFYLMCTIPLLSSVAGAWGKSRCRTIGLRFFSVSRLFPHKTSTVRYVHLRQMTMGWCIAVTPSPTPNFLIGLWFPLAIYCVFSFFQLTTQACVVFAIDALDVFLLGK